MSQSGTARPLSQPMLDGLRAETSAFAGAFGRYRTPLYLTAGAETERVEGDMVTGTFFEVLGLRAAHGRLFTADDDRTPSGHPVVVLGHSFFERRFGGDPSVVGRVVSVNSHPMTVVGVAPRGFSGVEVGSATDVYVPVAMQREAQPTWGNRLGDWRSRFLVSMARLRDGVSLEEARAQANVVYARLLAEDLAHIESAPASLKESFLKRSLVLLPGARGISGLRDQSGKPLLVLMGDGRTRAPDRLCQRGEPAAHARLGAAEGNGAAAGARGEPHAARAPAPRREPRRWRRPGACSACSLPTGSASC